MRRENDREKRRNEKEEVWEEEGKE